MKLLKPNKKHLRGRYFSTPIPNVFAQTDMMTLVWSNTLEADALAAPKEYDAALHATFDARRVKDGLSTALVEFGALAKRLRKLTKLTTAPDHEIIIEAGVLSSDLTIKSPGADEYNTAYVQLLRRPLRPLRCRVNAQHLARALRTLALPPKAKISIAVGEDALGEGEDYCPLMIESYLLGHDGAQIVSVAQAAKGPNNTP